MFGFLNGLFLFGLGAMAVPIIIHILNRRRQRKIDFSSLEFIFEMSKRRMSKINFRRWLILLLRTLAIVMLVIAFARPTLRSNAALFMPGDTPKNVVLCIDVSGSMNAELATGTAFTAAQALAKQVIDDAGGNDVMNIVTFGARSDVLFASGTRNRQIVKNAIGALETTYEVTGVREAMTKALEVVETSDVAGGEIYVISDFRESADSLVVADLPKGVRIMFLPVYDEAIDNVSIDRVFTPRKVIRQGEVVRVSATVTNHSRQQPANFPLELYVGESRKAEKVVNLSPASSATVTFSVSLNKWGAHRCRVAKQRDRLPVDDDRYFLLEVSRRIPVTSIRGRTFLDDGRKPAAYFYVDKALNPRGSGEGEFDLRSLDQGDLNASSLRRGSVVVWSDPRTIDRSRLSLLKRHIHAGGTALVFIGDDRRGLWRDAAFAEYLGFRSATLKQRTDGERIVSFQTEHPVFAIFSEEELELLTMGRIREHLSVSGVAPDSVLAYFGSGDPAMWECRRGDGRMLVVALSPSIASGDIVLSPMFLPLIHTSVSYLAAAVTSGAGRENIAGEDLLFDLPAYRGEEGGLVVRHNSGLEARAAIFENPSGEIKAIMTRPHDVGFYQLRADTATIAEASVNVDTRESTLYPRSLDTAALGEVRLIDTAGDFASNLQAQKQGREVFALFLLLAVAALVAESLLGRKA